MWDEINVGINKAVLRHVLQKRPGQWAPDYKNTEGDSQSWVHNGKISGAFSLGVSSMQEDGYTFCSVDNMILVRFRFLSPKACES